MNNLNLIVLLVARTVTKIAIVIGGLIEIRYDTGDVAHMLFFVTLALLVSGNE